MIARNVVTVNKIIIQYRSNGKGREVGESQQVTGDRLQKWWDRLELLEGKVKPISNNVGSVKSF
jgi:hypothetical protein